MKEEPPPPPSSLMLLLFLHTAIDLKNDGGSLLRGPYDGKADVTFTVADQDFMEVVQGKLNPQKVEEAPPGHGGHIPAVTSFFFFFFLF